MPSTLPRLQPDLLISRPAETVAQSWTALDTVLYNLGIGFGAAAATDEAQLRFVLEDKLTAFPTMAAVLGVDRDLYRNARYGLDFAGMLHGEEAVEIKRPLPPHGSAIGHTRVEGIWDRGAEKGAVMTLLKTLRDANDNSLIAISRSTIVLRGNGGFGGSSEGAPRAARLPERPPDGSHDIATRPEQALLYRLSGDKNPLHSTPAVAARAGFSAPILHGLCSFALAARGVVASEAHGDERRLTAFSVRFVNPAYPGETIRTEFWRLGDGMYALRSRSVERDVILLNNGRAQLAG